MGKLRLPGVNASEGAVELLLLADEKGCVKQKGNTSPKASHALSPFGFPLKRAGNLAKQNVFVSGEVFHSAGIAFSLEVSSAGDASYWRQCLQSNEIARDPAEGRGNSG